MLFWIDVSLIVLQVAVTWGLRRELAKHDTVWLAPDGMLGFDKLNHFAWSVAAFFALAALGVGGPLRWLTFLVLACAVEVVELARFATWVERKRPQPWPVLCDAVSWRDLVWDFAGAVVAALLLRGLP